VAKGVQVTFDCADPFRLVAFWAEVLDYVVEDNSERVKAALDAGHLPAEQAIELGGGKYAFTFIAACFDPSRAGPRFLFVQVPEGKTAKNRCHPDLASGDEGLAAMVSRLEGLGAKKLYEIDEPWGHFVTLQDPEGNEFCVA
jgi:hypothetical protein